MTIPFAEDLIQVIAQNIGNTTVDDNIGNTTRVWCS